MVRQLKAGKMKPDQQPAVRIQAQTKNSCRVCQESCLLEISPLSPSWPILINYVPQDTSGRNKAAHHFSYKEQTSLFWS